MKEKQGGRSKRFTCDECAVVVVEVRGHQSEEAAPQHLEQAEKDHARAHGLGGERHHLERWARSQRERRRWWKLRKQAVEGRH